MDSLPIQVLLETHMSSRITQFPSATLLRQSSGTIVSKSNFDKLHLMPCKGPWTVPAAGIGKVIGGSSNPAFASGFRYAGSPDGPLLRSTSC